eukprot:6197026-Pleurochrysis_carterae.AAC.1
MVSNFSQAQSQQIDYPYVAAMLREMLDKQIAKREKHQSIVSYAMGFLHMAGIHNVTIMVVESRILEGQRVAKSSMDWTSGGAQFHSPTLHTFLNGLHHNAAKDDVVPPADYVHKRIRYQLAFSEKLLMPINTCVPPIQTTTLGTPDWWAAFKRTIMEIRVDVGE